MSDLPIWLWIVGGVLAFILLTLLVIKGWKSWSVVAEGVCSVTHDETTEFAGVCPHTYDDQYAVCYWTIVRFVGGEKFEFRRHIEAPYSHGPMRLMKNWWDRYRLEAPPPEQPKTETPEPAAPSEKTEPELPVARVISQGDDR